MTSTYELLEVLGHGGMADVHRAHDHDLERDVAVKVLSEKLADNERFIHLFLAEARKMASVSHPNVLPIYGVDDDGQQRPRLIMELAQTTLVEPMAAGPCDPVQVKRIARQVLLGLEAIHQAGLVHQDIKPANIFLSHGFYKIGDFGIATEGDQHTQLLATPKYLAPEVLDRPHLVGPASDLYSLGLVLYEALVGTATFEATVAKVVEDSLTGLEVGRAPQQKQVWRSFHGGLGQLPPCHHLDSEIPRDLSTWLARLIHKDLNQRVQTCREALTSLDHGGAATVAGLPEGAEVTQPLGIVGKKPHQRRWLVGLSLAFVVSLGSGWFWHQRQWVTLDVTSEPSGATVFEGRQALGPTPRTHRMRLGTALELRHEGYEPQRLLLEDRLTDTLFGTLQWRPILVQSIPEAALVRRLDDDATLGQTPIKVIGDGERFELALEADGYDVATLILEPGSQPSPVVLTRQRPSLPANPTADELLQVLESWIEPPETIAIERFGRSDSEAHLGDELRFQVRAKEAVHGAVFLLDSNADMILLYPSPRGGEVRLSPGGKALIPLPEHRAAGYVLEASEPLGRDRVFLLTSSLPLPRPPDGEPLGPWSTLHSFAPMAKGSAFELVQWVIEICQKVDGESRLVMNEISIAAIR